jgi:hypothetical protein
LRPTPATRASRWRAATPRRRGCAALELREGSWFDAVGADERFEVVVSNPPYVAEGEAERLPHDVRDFEPALALYSGASGLEALREIVDEAPRHLVAGGLLALELDETRAREVASWLEGAHDWRDVELRDDLSGRHACCSRAASAAPRSRPRSGRRSARRGVTPPSQTYSLDGPTGRAFQRDRTEPLRTPFASPLHRLASLPVHELVSKRMFGRVLVMKAAPQSHAVDGRQSAARDFVHMIKFEPHPRFAAHAGITNERASVTIALTNCTFHICWNISCVTRALALSRPRGRGELALFEVRNPQLERAAKDLSDFPRGKLVAHELLRPTKKLTGFLIDRGFQGEPLRRKRRHSGPVCGKRNMPRGMLRPRRF